MITDFTSTLFKQNNGVLLWKFFLILIRTQKPTQNVTLTAEWILGSTLHIYLYS